MSNEADQKFWPRSRRKAAHHQQPECPVADGPATAPPKSLWPVIRLVLGVILLLGLIHFSPLSEFFDEIQAFQNRLEDAEGFRSEAFFFFVSTLLVALGAPRLIFYAIAGATFESWKGLLLAQAASLAGSFVTYKLVRLTGRTWARRRFGRKLAYQRLSGAINTPWSVFVLRQLPLSSGLLNLSLGLSSVRAWPFLAGSFLGFLPQGLVVVLIADGIMEESVADGALRFLGAVVVFLFVAYLGIRYRPRPKPPAEG